MIYRACSIAGVFYGNLDAAAEEGIQVDDTLNLFLDKDDVRDDTPLHQFFLALSTCNTVVPAVVSTEEFSGRVIYHYDAESPDEAALVAAAEAYGYVLEQSGSGITKLHARLRGKQELKVLQVLPFDSDRKRMSIVVRLPDGTLRLMTKGADISVLSVLSAHQDGPSRSQTERHIESMARKGLRTLVFAYRNLSTEFYARWSSQWAEARYGKQQKPVAKLYT